jgi:predicted RNase H-like HicB family nuclease
MRSITLNFTVQGDTYEELREKADISIARFLGVAEVEEDDFFDDEYVPEFFQNVNNYELVVIRNDGLDNEFEYTAQVIGKIKDARTE